MANGEPGQCRHGGWTNEGDRAKKGDGDEPLPSYYGAEDRRHADGIDGCQRPGRTDRQDLGRRRREGPSWRDRRPADGPCSEPDRAALNRDGSPCRNGAMAGSPSWTTFNGGAVEWVPNRCRGTTKAGKPCRAARCGDRVLRPARASTLTATGGARCRRTCPSARARRRKPSSRCWRPWSPCADRIHVCRSSRAG